MIRMCLRARPVDRRSTLRSIWIAGAASLLLAGTPVAAAPPPNGTPIQARFCGTIVDLDPVFENYGLHLDAPFLGELNLVQRPPDFIPGPDQTRWECESPYQPCGEIRIDFQTFTPPQTLPDASRVFGPITDIDQTSFTYHAAARFDGFVAGAIGSADLQMFCIGCGFGNDVASIAPTMSDAAGEIQGLIEMTIVVPGIGGSLNPPSGAEPYMVRALVTGVGGRCNQVLPTSSSLGLGALAISLVLGTLFLARSKTRPRSEPG